MNKIDFINPPYNHAGSWTKTYSSIFSPSEKVTWPQYMAEMVIYWRSKLIPDFPEIRNGPGWSKNIQRQVRMLNQQMASISNWFEHPLKEPLVIMAVKKFFRENRVTSVGGFRKTRTKKSESGREVLNISQAEKDIINGVNHELQKAIKNRNVLSEVRVEQPSSLAKNDNSFGGVTAKGRGSSLAHLLNLEKQIKEKNG